MNIEFTKKEIRLAQTLASQMEQIGLDKAFCKSITDCDNSFAMECIDIASDIWADKIKRIQQICMTRIEATQTIAMDVLNKLDEVG